MAEPLAESPVILAESPKKPVPPQLTPFTNETASKAIAKRWNAHRERQLIPQPEVKPQKVNSLPDNYLALRLVRVRAQLDLVDAAIVGSVAKDSKRLKELTDAQARLEEQERRLSNRPLPGSRKPAPERTRQVEAAATLLVSDEPEYTATAGVLEQPHVTERPQEREPAQPQSVGVHLY